MFRKVLIVSMLMLALASCGLMKPKTSGGKLDEKPTEPVVSTDDSQSVSSDAVPSNDAPVADLHEDNARAEDTPAEPSVLPYTPATDDVKDAVKKSIISFNGEAVDAHDITMEWLESHGFKRQDDYDNVDTDVVEGYSVKFVGFVPIDARDTHDCGSITLEYYNDSEKAVPLKECPLSGVSINAGNLYADEFYPGFDFIAPCDVKMGTAKQDVLAVYGAPENVYDGTIYPCSTYDYLFDNTSFIVDVSDTIGLYGISFSWR